jgi:hypothetical protein
LTAAEKQTFDADAIAVAAREKPLVGTGDDLAGLVQTPRCAIPVAASWIDRCGGLQWPRRGGLKWPHSLSGFLSLE